MDSKLIICTRCGLRISVQKEDFNNHRFCHRCGEKTDGNVEQNECGVKRKAEDNLEETLELNAPTVKRQAVEIELETKLANKIDELERKYGQLAQTVADNKKMLTDKIDAVDKSHLDNGKRLDVKQSQELSKLRLELASNISPFEYIWKVEEFANHQAQAKLGTQTCVYSDPFHPNKLGYKMRLMLYPNGVSTGKGTHLAIYLQVMKGPNDAILKWPIEYSAKFSVLDQSIGEDHDSMELIYDLIAYKDSYAKPITEHNLALGIATFMLLEKLKPLYLVDDTIFVKLDLTITSSN